MDFSDLGGSSILISDGGKRPNLLYRCLSSIANSHIEGRYEVVLATDNTDFDDTLKLLKNFPFTSCLVVVDNKKFEDATGIKHYFNNPSLTNNAAYMNSSYENIFLMGNEIIAYRDVFNVMLKKLTHRNQLVLSTTYDVPEALLARINKNGSNIDEIVAHCLDYPLASRSYHSDVTNYLSLTHASVWDRINGYNEMFCAGIACEDSDFVRRCRALPDFETVRCGNEAISLHQFHGGKTCYYEPKREVIELERWNRGVEINRAVYDVWDGRANNPMSWTMAENGVVEVIYV